MKKWFWRIGLGLAFAEALLFLSFALENTGNISAILIQTLPGLAVLIPAVVGIRFRKSGGVMLLVEALTLALWWGVRSGGTMSLMAYVLMPGGLALAGVLLLLGKRPGENHAVKTQ